MAEPLLEVEALHAWYGESHVLHGASFRLEAGEVVTLLGRNGAGKTTCLRAILGLVPRWRGVIRFRGAGLAGLATHRIARRGIAWCPEERGIFGSLSVGENLLLPPVLGPGGFSEAELDEIFPILRERRGVAGTKLSGGEQQMLAIARILRSGASLLLLDEPTEGLAPGIVARIGEAIRRAVRRGRSVLLVEQNLDFAAALADRHYVLEQGVVVDRVGGVVGPAERQRIGAWLGV